MLQHRRNNSRALDGPIRLADNVGKMMSKVEDTYEMWFRVWRDTWVPKLMRAPKWFNGTVDLETGDLVYFQRTASELGHNSDRWVVGKVSKLERGKDGKVRRVWIQYKNFNENNFQVTERSARSVIKIFSLSDSSVQEDLLEVQRFMKEVLGSQFVEYASQGGSWKDIVFVGAEGMGKKTCCQAHGRFEDVRDSMVADSRVDSYWNNSEEEFYGKIFDLDVFKSLTEAVMKIGI